MVTESAHGYSPGDFVMDLDYWSAGWRGMRTVKTVPASDDDVTSMLPPWEVEISRAMYNPSPMRPG